VTVLVYRWRTHARMAAQLPPGVFDQLRLANRLWNDLVRIELDRDQAVRDMWSGFPQIADAETRIAALEEQAAELGAQVAKERSRQRTRAPKHPAVAQLREVKAARRQAKQDRRDAIAQARADCIPRLIEITTESRTAVKALYRTYVYQGMYWPVYNDIVDHWTVACSRVKADRAKGRPASLRFHRFDGSGALTVQLQRGSKQPPRFPELLADREGSPWRNVFTAPWTPPAEHADLKREDRKRAGRQAIRMRVGDQQVQIPVQMMDRTLPADAEVTYARLVLERCAGHTDVHVDVTLKLPDPAPAADGPACAVHVGWCREDDDSVRVATLAWGRLTPIPDGLANVDGYGTSVVRDLGQGLHAVVLPAAWLPRMDLHQQVQSERDKRLDEVKALVLDITAQITDPDDRPENVALWRSLARFGALARRWRDDPPVGADPQDLARLEHWRAWDRSRWEVQEHGRRWHLRRRDQMWARVAAWIAREAGMVTVDDTAVATLGRRPALTDLEPIPESVTTGEWAGQRVDATPGGLRSRVTQTCAREGVPVVSISASDITRMCPWCGHVEEEAPGPGVRTVRCSGCLKVRDVDESAARIVLARGATARAASTDRSTGDDQPKQSMLRGRRRRRDGESGTARGDV
jgi:hypothetical protein